MRSAQPVRIAGPVLRGLLLWLLIALIFWALAALPGGIDIPSFGAVLLTTGLVALLNALLWPFLIRLLLPLTVLTFGLGSLVLNAVIVSISIAIVDGSAPNFGSAVLLAFALSVSLLVLAPALSIDDDARQSPRGSQARAAR